MLPISSMFRCSAKRRRKPKPIRLLFGLAMIAVVTGALLFALPGGQDANNAQAASDTAHETAGPGECSRCSCPGFSGSGYTCYRGGCNHHYDDHY